MENLKNQAYYFLRHTEWIDWLPCAILFLYFSSITR